MANNEKRGFARSDEVFASALKAARERAGLTQEELAKEMGLRSFDFHQQTIYKIESGQRRVTVGEGVALSDILNVPLEVMTEVDSTSVRALRNTARGSAMDFFSALIEVTYTLGQVKGQELPELKQWVRDHDQALRVYGPGGSRDAPLVDELWPLLSFTGLGDYGQAWRELFANAEALEVLRSLGFNSDDLDEYSRYI